jgi:hypothetical protein
MAVADGALFGIESLDDLQKLEIPPGEEELILSFKESALDRPILRKCTKEKGTTEEKMPKKAFLRIFAAMMKKAGYFCGTSIHAVRRNLGKKVDGKSHSSKPLLASSLSSLRPAAFAPANWLTLCPERYSAVQRSQHLTQADPRVFGQSYVANCSSVNGQDAFLGESTDHRHIDYFQGLEKFREHGLPCELPANRKESLKQDPHVRELEQEIQRLQVSQSTLDEAKKRLFRYRSSLRDKALRAYQEEWVRRQRESKILNRGKQPAMDVSGTDQLQSLCLLIPERGRLATWIASDAPLSPSETWQAIRDLHSLCVPVSTVLYLPGREPVQGACPVARCKLNLTR